MGGLCNGDCKGGKNWHDRPGATGYRGVGMMNLDGEELSRDVQKYQVGAVLDGMSLDELNATIGLLGEEIARIEREIARKQAGLRDAEGVFNL